MSLIINQLKVAITNQTIAIIIVFFHFAGSWVKDQNNIWYAQIIIKIIEIVPAIHKKKLIDQVRIFGISSIWISQVLRASSVFASSHLKSHSIPQSASTKREFINNHKNIKNNFLIDLIIKVKYYNLQDLYW